ncbi:MAG: hypothetical protein ACRC6E_05335 [Fusobacteriaceae bacterium]
MKGRRSFIYYIRVKKSGRLVLSYRVTQKESFETVYPRYGFCVDDIEEWEVRSDIREYVCEDNNWVGGNKSIKDYIVKKLKPLAKKYGCKLEVSKYR